MPKDALGHGSDERGVHAAQTASLPAKGTPISDATYHANMPKENFTGMVQDLLGMWKGTQQPDALSPGEAKQVSDAYEARGDWRQVARDLDDARKGQKLGGPGGGQPNARGSGWA
jgi:hypothetical protein